MASSSRVYVIGSSIVDTVYAVQRFVQPGESLIAVHSQVHPGGKGANQAMAAARLGCDVTFFTCVGQDPFAETVLAPLAEEGVNLKYIQKTNRAGTGRASISVLPDGTNAIIVDPGANMQLQPRTLLGDIMALPDPAVIVAQLESPLECTEAAFLYAQRKKIVTILNPAPARKIPESLLALCEFITPNETECRILTGLDPHDLATCRRACEVLQGRGVGNVVLTLGDRGAFWKGPDAEAMFPARKVEAKDTTAAGDAFNGALAAGLAQGMDVYPAIQRAVEVATLCVLKAGAQESMPRLDELEVVR